jgi:hypothetical protein
MLYGHAPASKDSHRITGKSFMFKIHAQDFQDIVHCFQALFSKADSLLLTFLHRCAVWGFSVVQGHEALAGRLIFYNIQSSRHVA